MPLEIKVEKNLREQIPYPDVTFPFCVWTDVYNLFLDHTVNCHWHYDFEYGYVVSGIIDYYINDTCIKLRKGDCVFVNSNMLHMSMQSKGCNDAEMFTVTFPASLLTSSINSTVYTKILRPVIDNRIEGFILASNSIAGQEMGNLLTALPAMKPSDFGYELICLSCVCQLWLLTLRNIMEANGALLLHTGSIHNAERAKEILSYIHAHYHEKITVEDIASHVSISRSECFRCFKRFMNKKPVAYINEYRLLRAAKLLRETEMSIVAVYTECGFENASYFGKLFKQTYGMTPLQYRKVR